MCRLKAIEGSPWLKSPLHYNQHRYFPSKMPRELRKRGRKHKKPNEPGPSDPSLQAQKDHHEKPSEPSWIISVPQAEDAHPEAPFGYVDPDIKAYFRTVDEQIRTWQEDEHKPETDNDDLDPNEGASFSLKLLRDLTIICHASCSETLIFCCCPQ
jgi:hypothetical protein